MTFQDLEDIPMTETVELLKSTVKPQIKPTINHTSPTNTPEEIHITVDSEDYKKCFLSGKKKPQHHHLEDISAILKLSFKNPT